MLNSIINYIFEPDTQKKFAEYAIIIGLLLILTTIFILMKTPADIFILLLQIILGFLAFKHSRYLYTRDPLSSIGIGAIFIIIIICNILSLTCNRDNNFLRIFMLILDMIIMILYLFLFFYANETRCNNPNNPNNKKYNMFCDFFQNNSLTAQEGP